MPATLEDEILKCPDCGKEFGKSEAVLCHICKSPICVHCGRCNCLLNWDKAMAMA